MLISLHKNSLHRPPYTSPKMAHNIFKWLVVDASTLIGTIITPTMIMTSFRSITMFCGTDIILQNIPSFTLNAKNILQNTVSPTEHCYGCEECYEYGKRVTYCIETRLLFFMPTNRRRGAMGSLEGSVVCAGGDLAWLWSSSKRVVLQDFPFEMFFLFCFGTALGFGGIHVVGGLSSSLLLLSILPSFLR